MSCFSVLMSVYYKEKPEFFSLALESILERQSMKPTEFILVCDGDLIPDLEIIIDKYRKQFPDILKVYRKGNGGLGKALNFGLLKCTCPIVARADSDDICAPNRFETQMRFLDEHPEIGIISSYIDEFDSNWMTPLRIKTLPLAHEDIYRMAKVRNPLNHMAVMMRRDVVLNLGSYHHVPFVEDYDLWVRALISGVKMANIPEVLVHARVGNGMAKRRGSRESIKSWKVINKQMLEGGMIGYLAYLRNMFLITSFVLMPVGIKEFLYKNILRRS